MRRARWLANWQHSSSKPVIGDLPLYLTTLRSVQASCSPPPPEAELFEALSARCISRVVDRRFVFGERECEAFRMYHADV